MECLKENGNEECGAKNYAGFLTQKKEPDMTRTSRCLVSHYNAGITRFGESSGVLHCKACDGKCVQARAALTPERENKRQNGRRFKNVGEPGFTLTAFLTGMIFGFFLKGKEITWKSVLPASLLVILGCNLCLDTLWLSILMGDGYLALLPARILKCVLMLPIHLILIPFVWNRIVSKIPFAGQMTA